MTGTGQTGCRFARHPGRFADEGNYSATDETQLSFEMVSIDTRAKQMTVRECLWNKTPKAPAPMPIVWGLSETLSLVPPL